MTLPPMASSECTYPARDFVPVDTSGGDVDLHAALGFIARGVRADGAGLVVCRFADTPVDDPDREMTLQAGEFVEGFFTDIKSTSTATLHVAR